MDDTRCMVIPKIAVTSRTYLCIVIHEVAVAPVQYAAGDCLRSPGRVDVGCNVREEERAMAAMPSSSESPHLTSAASA